MKIGIPRESGAGERRVAVTPEGVKQLRAAGAEVLVETGAGAGAFHGDDAYTAAGATIANGPGPLWSDSDVILKIQPPLPHPTLGRNEADLVKERGVLVCMLRPFSNLDAVRTLAARNVSSFSMDLIPRTTRAQRMDALSSMATAAGYKAVLLAATTAPRFFPMLVTAAGTVAPARVLIVGAGVAGLQAIATARRLGAVVEGYDIRPAAREEVESLGATFVGPKLTAEETQDAAGYAKQLSAEARAKAQELLLARIPHADVIITTARVPGLPAPKLIPADAVAKMKPGSVIVDLAADMGGNCELTAPGADVVKHDVTIHGPIRLAATIPIHASQMYSRNITGLALLMIQKGALALNFEDDIVRDTCVTHEGKVLHGPTRERIEGSAGAGAAGGGAARSGA
ncbi:MAG TPA: Re/Si-specific NAD(P)(+) transhydrogenase subunit alpha [Candidatus Eisenbacteria bacterium]|nr:Re/Si-specific NAD(P)(+) transhydrogenase subunit alpha [Candidatus Eisenbacteria bacterium]